MKRTGQLNRGMIILLPIGCVVALVAGLVWFKMGVAAVASTPPVEAAAQTFALTADPALPPETPAWSPAGPDLVGRVTAANGEAISGARILIDAAGPRVGRGYT